MEIWPHVWVFFIPFIMVTTFAVVNLLVGLIVNSMHDAYARESNAATERINDKGPAWLTVYAHFFISPAPHNDAVNYQLSTIIYHLSSTLYHLFFPCSTPLFGNRRLTGTRAESR